MNYGKSAYLKVVELEKRIGIAGSQTSNEVNFLEYNKLNLNYLLTNISRNTITFPDIDLKENKEICFQIKITLSSKKETNLQTIINVNSLEVHSEDNFLSCGHNEFLVLKAFTPTISSKVPFSISFETSSAEDEIIIDDIKIIIMGLSGNNTENNIQTNAIELKDNFLISYIESNKLYYQFCAKSSGSILAKNFINLCSAYSHCFMPESKNCSNENIFLLKVDENKNLKLYKPFKSQEEKLIDSNVSFVSGTILNNQEDSHLIVYIKGGEVYFTTIRNSNILSPKKLTFPDLNFKQICIASCDCSEVVYVIATTESNSNYIINSAEISQTSKIVENLNAKIFTISKRYIDLSICDEKAIHTLSLAITSCAKNYETIEGLLNKKCKTNIYLTGKSTSSNYHIPQGIIYGVKLNKHNLDSLTWATYTDDAKNFEAAYFDFNNGTFVPNGWDTRWPFNQIKPCIIKSGEIVNYLDPNDYTKFIDGTDSEINNPESGMPVIEIPRIYYKISKDYDNIYVQISNVKYDGFCNISHTYLTKELEKIYVSIYPGPTKTYSNDGFHLNSGITVDLSAQIGFLKTHNPLNKYPGARWENISFSIHTLLCCLFIVLFKTTSSKNAIGAGLTEKVTTFTTGSLDKKGMFYGSKQSSHTKFFGLEDYFGVSKTICIGICIDKENRYKYLNPYISGVTHKVTNVTKYVEVQKPYSVMSTTPTVATDINGTNETGFLPTAYSKSTDTTKGFEGLCKGMINSTCCLIGSTPSQIGSSLFDLENINSTSTINRMIRLVYYPNP